MSRAALMGLAWGLTIASFALMFVNGVASFLVSVAAFACASQAWRKRRD
jgi:hypothetical protein